MTQPEVFRRVASEFLLYPRSEPLTAEQICDALQVCPLVVCKAMVSCAPLFLSLQRSSERFRALVPSQDGPEQLLFPFVPTKWRPDWQGGKAGRFSMPLEWIEDRSFGHGFDYGVLLRCCDGARVHPRSMSVPVYSTRNPPLTSAILDHYSRPSLDLSLIHI